MHVRPDVLAGPGMRRVAALFGELDQQRHLHAVRVGAKAEAVDQARADDDRTAALVAVGENELVQRDPRHARGRWRDGGIFVEDRVGPLALGARADDARSRRMDECLAASCQGIEHGNDRALVIGARRIDDDVGGLRRLRQDFSVVERSQHRLDAPRANRLGLLGRANQSRHLMSGGDEMRRDRSADIARRARAKDFHLPTFICRHCLRQTRSVCAGSEATKQSISPLAPHDGLLRFVATMTSESDQFNPDAS